MAKAKVAEVAVKQYRVTAPVENWCGIGAGGVQFAYGQAIINEGWVLDWYREHGFKVEPIEESPTPSTESNEVTE